MEKTALITDLISKVASGTYVSPTKVTTVRSTGGKTLSCASLDGWDTTTAQFFVTYRRNADGTVVAGSETAWVGTVNANKIENLVLTAGIDNGNLVDDIVQAMPTHEYARRLATNILTHANQDGTLRDNIIENKHLIDKSIKEDKLDFSTFSAIRLKQGANQTINVTTADVTFNTTDLISGTKLTRSGNRVLIGTGVTKVRVSYAIMADNSSGASYLYTGIMKNTVRATMQTGTITNGQYASTSESTILGVAAGDTIGVVADCGAGSMVLSVSRLCNLVVEVIG